MSNYWINREKQRLELIDKSIDSHINNLQKRMIQAADNIENEIMHLYIKYAEDNNMSYTKALNYLTNNERKEFQKDLKYYVDTYRDKEKALFYKKELQALSTRARVKRLEVLRASILKEASQLYDFLSNDTYAKLSDILEESYLFNIYSMHQAGLKVKFDMLSKNVIEELLKYPWSGSNYSDKIWEKTEVFAKQIDKVMTTGLIQGKSIDSLVSDMRVAILGKEGKGGRLYDYKRLVRTEASFIAEQATIKSYRDCNIKEYEYLATLDLRTSETCQELDGKIFNVKEAITGKNYPPMHAFCRSTTVPVVTWDGEDEESVQRISRDPMTGKNKIIEDISYEKWKKDIYIKHGEDTINTQKQKIKNKSFDMKQYKEYKSKLDNHEMPKTFEEFQEIKYNNGVEWNALKAEYKRTSSLLNQIDYIFEGEKGFIPKDTIIRSVKTIAGKGTNTELRSADKLAESFGGSPDMWSKKVGKIESEKYIFDVHWNELDGKQYYMKIKLQKEKKR